MNNFTLPPKQVFEPITEATKKAFRDECSLFTRYLQGYLRILRLFHRKANTCKTPRQHALALVWLNNQLLAHFNQLPSVAELKTEAWLSDLEELTLVISGKLEEKVPVAEIAETLFPNENNSGFTRFFKSVKGFTFRTHTTLRKTGNFFGKVIKKEPTPLPIWYRNLPLQNIAIAHYSAGMLRSIAPWSDELLLNFSKLLLKLDDTNRRLDNFGFGKTAVDYAITEEESDLSAIIESVESIVAEVRGLFAGIETKIEAKSDEIYDQFSVACRLGGTLDLPSRKFSQNKLSRKYKKAKEQLEKLMTGRTQAIFALMDDLQFNRELLLSVHSIGQQRLIMCDNLVPPVKETILPSIEPVLTYYREVMLDIENSTDFDADLPKITQKTYQKLNRNLLKTAILRPAEANIPEIIGKYESRTLILLQSIVTERIILKNEKYTKPVKKSEYEYVSPGELIGFETLPNFSKQFAQIKQDTTLAVETLRSELKELQKITDYTLKAGGDIFADEDETPPLQIVKEGFKRIYSKAQAIRRNAESITEKPIADISEASKRTILSLLELTNNESAMNMKLRIAKASTLQRTIELRNAFTDYLKHLIPNLWHELTRLVNLIGGVYKYYQKRFGISKADDAISTDLSDYLSETEQAIKLLPYIYRRLFAPDPNLEAELYVARSTESQTLEKAYSNWIKGRFASVAIIGEKGSGRTTLIKQFFNNQLIQVRWLNPETIIYTQTDLLPFLAQIPELSGSDSIETLISKANNIKMPVVVVVGNIQKLFMKRVGGFDALEGLFRIISETGKSIFWVCSVTKYTWQYLNKSANIADRFAYVIPLSNLNEDEINHAILKRHSISGFTLRFKPTKKLKSNNKYKRTPENKRGEIAKTDFFDHLNEFTGSNLSLAFLFWQRATLKVTEKKITVGYNEHHDYSFLSKYPDFKVFTLHALLLHDGLTITQHAELFSKKESYSLSHFLLLEDDGIVFNKKGTYILNPLLYRQVVNLLKAKNFIH